MTDEKAQAVDAQPVAQEPWGWAIVDKDGNERDTRCRRVSMFGWSREHQSYGADAVERWDREWPGLAPHRVVTLYTTAQPAAPLRRLTEEQIVSAVLDEAKRQAGGEFAGLTMDVDAFRELLKVIRAIEPAFAEANGLTLGDAVPSACGECERACKC